jgi:uncharacterized membrane protein YkvA (DUF1232 family)
VPGDLALTAQPSPAARLGETLGRLPNYLRLTRALLGDRRLSRLRKAGLGAGLAYLASPIDLVPGIIPVFGQLDDLIAVLVAVRFALRGLPGPAADALLAKVDLSREVIARDIDNVRVTAAWAASGTGRAAIRLTKVGARVTARAATTGARLAGKATRAGAGAAGRALRTIRARRHARREADPG